MKAPRINLTDLSFLSSCHYQVLLTKLPRRHPCAPSTASVPTRKFLLECLIFAIGCSDLTLKVNPVKPPYIILGSKFFFTFDHNTCKLGRELNLYRLHLLHLKVESLLLTVYSLSSLTISDPPLGKLCVSHWLFLDRFSNSSPNSLELGIFSIVMPTESQLSWNLKFNPNNGRNQSSTIIGSGFFYLGTFNSSISKWS